MLNAEFAESSFGMSEFLKNQSESAKPIHEIRTRATYVLQGIYHFFMLSLPVKEFSIQGVEFCFELVGPVVGLISLVRELAYRKR